jgi:hypothetical protein
MGIDGKGTKAKVGHMDASIEGQAPNKTWFEDSPQLSLVGCLRHAALCFENAQHDPQALRWIILSLHLALQAALVCALDGYNQDGSATLQNDRAWRAWLQDRRNPPPNRRLADVRKLLERAQNPDLLPSPHTLQLDEDAAKDLASLTFLRNQLAHIGVNGTISIEKAGIPRILRTAVRVVGHLARDGSTFDHQLSETDRALIKQAMNQLSAKDGDVCAA